MTIPDIVGQNIRARRQELGWTQAELAERLDIHPTFVGSIERGVKFPSTVTLERICEVMQLRPYTLFIEEGVDENIGLLNETFRRYVDTLLAELPEMVKDHILLRQAEYFKVNKKHK